MSDNETLADTLAEFQKFALSAPPEQHTNAAALRAALENVRDIVRELADEVDQLEEVDLVCNTDQAGRIKALFREALRIAKAALDAPARNCDRFRTVDEAFAACHDDRGYLSNPIAERRSTISFMLSDAQKTPKFEQCDDATAEGKEASIREAREALGEAQQ